MSITDLEGLIDLERTAYSVVVPYYPLLAVTEALGLVAVALVATWAKKHLGGFGWEGPQKFNWHPMLMVLGMIYLAGNAIIVYRLLKHTERVVVKCLHAALHVLSMLLIIVALVAAIQYHNDSAVNNFYSLHSWIGLATVIAFGVQLSLAALVFILPQVPQQHRSALMPVHRFLGCLVFCGSIASALSGINEKLFLLNDDSLKKYSTLPDYAVVGNLLGVALVLYALGILVILSTPEYRREPTNMVINHRMSTQNG